MCKCNHFIVFNEIIVPLFRRKLVFLLFIGIFLISVSYAPSVPSWFLGSGSHTRSA